MIDFNSPQIVSSLIESIGTILATMLGSLTVYLVGKKFDKMEQLKSELRTALKDIEFLLEVEEKHCNKHKNDINESHKNKIRKIVKDKGYKWSGKNVKSRLRRFDN